MNLYLVQHGKAKSKQEDPNRPLTDNGRRETQLIVDMASRLGLNIVEIHHSGKTRAQQTAEIFADILSSAPEVKSFPGMAPLDDVQSLAEQLIAESQPLMLVGHLPFMARLSGYLVNNDPDNPPVEFHNAGILCLKRHQGAWRVRWHLTPGKASA